MAVSYKVDTSDVMRALKDLRDEDAPIVTAYALTKTAQDIKAAEVAKMSEVFDRPTKFTLNALYVKPAAKRDLTAEVFFKEGFGSVPAWRYLGPQVEGGARRHKAFELRLIRAGIMRSDEFAVPGTGVQLDQYGNVRGSLIERILSQLQAAENAGGAGYKANQTAASRKRKRNVVRYFALRPGGAGSANRTVAPGIYYRAPGARAMAPVLMFVRAPAYQKRFPFYETAQAEFQRQLVPRAREGFERFVLSKLKKAT